MTKKPDMPQEQASGPLRILQEAIKAVPAVKYALGVAGVAAAVALVYRFGIGPRVILLGTVVMFLLMTILVVFARLAALSKSSFNLPAQLLAWFSLLLLMAVSTLLVSCVFFRRPLDLSRWLDEGKGKTVQQTPSISPELYALRVQVLDPQGQPAGGSRIRTSTGNEPHLLQDGWWEIQIPRAKVPVDGWISLWAEHDQWAGNRVQLHLAQDPNPSVEIQLKKPETYLRGRVLDATGHTSAEARVFPQDGTLGLAITDADGRFELKLAIPREARIRVRAEHAGQPPGDAFCYAGRDTCVIVLGDQ
jgi:hypothetical protein